MDVLEVDLVIKTQGKIGILKKYWGCRKRIAGWRKNPILNWE